MIRPVARNSFPKMKSRKQARIAGISIYKDHDFIYSLDGLFESGSMSDIIQKPQNALTSCKMIISTLIQLSREFNEELKFVGLAKSTTILIQRGEYYFVMEIMAEIVTHNSQSVFIHACESYLQDLLNRFVSRLSLFSNLLNDQDSTPTGPDLEYNLDYKGSETIVNQVAEGALINQMRDIEFPLLNGMKYGQSNLRPIITLKSTLDLNIKLLVYHLDCVIYSDLELESQSALNDYICDSSTAIIDDFVINQIKNKGESVIQTTIGHGNFSGYLVGPNYAGRDLNYNAKTIILENKPLELILYQFKSQITIAIIAPKSASREYKILEHKLEYCCAALLMTLSKSKDAQKPKISKYKYLDYDLINKKLVTSPFFNDQKSKEFVYNIETRFRFGVRQVWSKFNDSWRVGLRNGHRKTFFEMSDTKSFGQAQRN